MTATERIHGALLGTVVGDALGRPFEGTAREDGRLHAAVERRAANPSGWDYSDDGEMALAVAESVVSCCGVDEGHLLATLAARHEPARGYGKGMRAAFRSLAVTGDWRAAPRALWAEGSRGNGSTVRTAAVAAWHVVDDWGAVSEAAARSAAVSHVHPDAVDATRAMALALWRLMRGGCPRELRSWLRRRDTAFGRLLRLQPSPSGQPFAVESFGLAMQVLEGEKSFAEAVRGVVALGGDTDTNGAMVGALAGAAYGRGAIPSSWVSALPAPAVRRTAELAQKLSARSRGHQPTPTRVDATWRLDAVSVPASANEDRVWAEADGDSGWIVVADGAGGTGHGAEAAALVVRRCRDARPTSGRAMVRLLEAIDRELAGRARGLTTAVVLRLEESRALGASVGDSAAWALGPSGCEELTEHQARQPLIGSGRATPAPFVRSPIERVLVATDGLGSYVPPGELAGLLEELAPTHAFVEAAKLPSGRFSDDITVVVAARKR